MTEKLLTLTFALLFLALGPVMACAQDRADRDADIRAALVMAAAELDWTGAIRPAPLEPGTTLYMVRDTQGLVAITEYPSGEAAASAFDKTAKGDTGTYMGLRASGSEQGGSLAWLSGRFVFAVASGAGPAGDLAGVLYAAAAENRLGPDDADVATPGTGPFEVETPETGDKPDLSAEATLADNSSVAAEPGAHAPSDTATPAFAPIATRLDGPGEIVSDSAWRTTATMPTSQAWLRPGFDEAGWRPAMRPWPAQPAPATSIAGMDDTTADWIWHPDAPDTAWFRRLLEMSYRPADALLRITADNAYELYVNGAPVGRDGGDAVSVWNTAETYDIAPLLDLGQNVIAIVARDLGGGSGLLLDIRFAGSATRPAAGAESTAAAPEALSAAGTGTPGAAPEDAQALLDRGKKVFQAAWGHADPAQREAALTEAFSLFQRAQELGSAEAIYQVGFMYETGNGVTQDNDIALSHYAEAARAGHTPAYVQLMLVQSQLGRADAAAGTFFDYWKAFPAAAEQGFDDLSYSPDVLRAIQRQLQRAGYYHGAVDGIIGPQTRAAIARYVAAEVPDTAIDPLGMEGAAGATVPPPPTLRTRPEAGYRSPAFGSPDRRAIIEAARPPVARDVGQPVIFVVDVIRTDGTWAYLQAVPHQPDGAPIDWDRTPFGPEIRDGMMSDIAMVLLRKVYGQWRVEDHVFGPTDVFWYGWVDAFGLPEALFYPG